MCGIAGFAGWPLGAEEAGRSVRAMCDAIVHRGPDDSGYFVAPEVALGMRRLSIIDVAGGEQPSRDGGGWVPGGFTGGSYKAHRISWGRIAPGHTIPTRDDTRA